MESLRNYKMEKLNEKLLTNGIDDRNRVDGSLQDRLIRAKLRFLSDKLN